MCFPAEMKENDYLITWSMWFFIEIASYLKRTGDFTLVKKAKERAYKFIDFCSEYTNEYGLLEGFNEKIILGYGGAGSTIEYLRGVNFPANMQYAAMIDCIAKLYGDSALAIQANVIRKTIIELSYNGTFFVDNAERVDGKLVCHQDHISEICQDYAMFFGVIPDMEFEERLIKNFGPLRKEGVYPEIDRVDMFNAHYLRFFWLVKKGEYARMIKEAVEYLYPQTQLTGTLWEFDLPIRSCSHGYATVVAPLINLNLTISNISTQVYEQNMTQGITTGNPAGEKFWPFQLVDKMANLLDEAEAQYDYLKVYAELYNTMVNRVRQQKVTVQYLQMQNYMHYYSQADILEILDEMEKTVNKNGFLRIDERDSEGSLAKLIQGWRRDNT